VAVPAAFAQDAQGNPREMVADLRRCYLTTAAHNNCRRHVSQLGAEYTLNPIAGGLFLGDVCPSVLKPGTTKRCRRS
jgi:hypothetical protein